MRRALSLVVVLFALGVAMGRPDPTEVKLSVEERKILDLTNAERAKLKLSQLKPNALLAEAARAHTANMAKQGKLDHVLDEMDPAARLKKIGYAYGRYAENVAMGQEAKPDELFKLWMESPPHKANLLLPDLEEIGIGWTRTPKGDCYATQVFGKPLKK